MPSDPAYTRGPGRGGSLGRASEPGNLRREAGAGDGASAGSAGPAPPPSRGRARVWRPRDARSGWRSLPRRRGECPRGSSPRATWPTLGDARHVPRVLARSACPTRSSRTPDRLGRAIPRHDRRGLRGVFETNFLGSCEPSTVLPEMIRRGSGRVLIVSSVVASGDPSLRRVLGEQVRAARPRGRAPCGASRDRRQPRRHLPFLDRDGVPGSDERRGTPQRRTRRAAHRGERRAAILRMAAPAGARRCSRRKEADGRRERRGPRLLDGILARVLTVRGEKARTDPQEVKRRHDERVGDRPLADETRNLGESSVTTSNRSCGSGCVSPT